MTAQTADDRIADKLDRLIELLSRPAVPLEHALWNQKEVAQYLGVSEITVARYATRRGFPVARKLSARSSGGSSAKQLPRWNAAEIIAWADEQR